MTQAATDVLITGIGLVSSLGEGVATHRAHLESGKGPLLETEAFAPYPVHPLAEIDFSQQIPRKGDLRQMEPWQRIGTYAAGLALEDAGIAGEAEFLDRTHMIVAAGSGERDTNVDRMVLEKQAAGNGEGVSPNEILPSQLRPTLFLAQLSNLLAGNISIVHKVTGSSRTFMGEEMAGMSAAEIAVKRIHAGQGDLFLIGGACNAERKDLLLMFELGHHLWSGDFVPVWARAESGGGFVAGSVGAFLVLESRAHAEARGARVYGRISHMMADRTNRQPGAAAQVAENQFAQIAPDLAKESPLAVLSGASGANPATQEERAFLETLGEKGFAPAIRAYGSVLGHSVEAHFPAGLALAAMAVASGQFYPPFEADREAPHEGPVRQVLVTGWGHWRGEAMALVEAP